MESMRSDPLTIALLIHVFEGAVAFQMHRFESKIPKLHLVDVRYNVFAEMQHPVLCKNFLNINRNSDNVKSV